MRHSWTRWSQKRTAKKLVKAEERLLLLKLEVDSQHLRIKELTHRSQALAHRERETLESRTFHLLPAATPLPAEQPDPVRALLGR